MPVLKSYAPKNNQQGFTLVELIVGITVLSGALLFLTGVLVPQAQRSTDPWFQVRSAELAQSMMNEINARSFDENSSRTGGGLRCDESGASACIGALPACTASNTWSEESTRDQYDDIDDFHCFSATGDAIANSENTQLLAVYSGFSVDVTVVYAGTELGLADNRLAKKISVEVTPPRGVPINYTHYRTNY